MHPVIKKEYLPVKDIIIDGINPRQFVDDESLKDFADSADDRGFLQPIGVHRNGNNTTQLIWGKRRILAAIKTR